jgi:hypothetical protein
MFNIILKSIKLSKDGDKSKLFKYISSILLYTFVTTVLISLLIISFYFLLGFTNILGEPRTFAKIHFFISILGTIPTCLVIFILYKAFNFVSKK